VGTPTPEPPDFDPLPRPFADGISATVRAVDADVFVDTGGREINLPVTVPLTAAAGTVLGGSEIWLVNLDDPNSAPLTLSAKSDGSFTTTVTGIAGQRVRLIYRTASKHSLPLDLEITGSGMFTAITPLRAKPFLPCFSITPSEEITESIARGASARQTFTLENGCSEAVDIERAELRFGDAGFRLTTPPDSVPANGSAKLTVIFPDHDDERERADIVLLELSSSGQSARYGLGVWSSGTGSD
jgi:hypothetical protein